MKYDLLMINGKIYSMEQEGQWFTAIGIKDGRIVQLYQQDPPNPEKSAKQVVDVKGKAIVPGFIDSHVHFAVTAAMNRLNFTVSELVNGKLEPTTLDGVRIKTTELAKTRPGKKPLFFNSCVTASFKERRLPMKSEIDTWFGDRLVAFITVDGHSMSFSSEGLRTIGIDPTNHNGLLDESMEEMDIDSIMRLFSKFITLPMIIQGVQSTVNKALEYGIVGIHCMDGFQKNPDKDQMLFFVKLLGSRIPLKLRLYPQVRDVNLLKKTLGYMSRPRVGGCAAWEMDGAVGAKTAAFYKPYLDDPKNFGEILYPAKTLSNDIQSAYEQGFQITSHAIGTKAIDHFLDAIEPIMDQNNDTTNRLRNRIDHFEFPTKEALDRAITKLKLIVVPQPGFNWINANYPGMQMYEKFLDPEIVALQNPLQSILQRGGIICGSTDSPIQTLNPFMQIYGMVNFPIESERISVYEAFRTYTYNGAYCTFEEQERGTLVEGKVADFIILNQDPFEIPTNRIPDLRVEATYIDGKRGHPDTSKPWIYLLKLLSRKRKKM